MKIRIELAGIPIEIYTLYDSLGEVFKKYKTTKKPAFVVMTTEQDIIRERAALSGNGDGTSSEQRSESPEFLENIAVLRKISEKLPAYDAILVLGSAIAVGQDGFLFIGPSGTGKTTHIELWQKNIENSVIIGDGILALRLQDGTSYISGTPWTTDESYGSSRKVPLEGIALIKRDTHNSIRPIDFSKVVPFIISQIFRPDEGEIPARMAKNMESICLNTRIYELSCNMEDEAALIAYGGML